MTSLVTVLLPTIGRPSLDWAMASVSGQTVGCDLIVEYDVDRIGPGPMLNRMLPHVATPWVATLADDDSYEPHFGETLAAQPQDADLIVFGMRYRDGRVLPDVTDTKDLQFGGVGCSYAVKTEVARRIGWINEPWPAAEDWPMISAVRACGTVRMVPEVVYRVRH